MKKYGKRQLLIEQCKRAKRPFLLLFLSMAPLFLFSLEPLLWEPTEYIWNLGIMLQCDKRMATIPQAKFDPLLYQNIQEGDVIYVRSEWFHRFVNEILPSIRHPFILITGDGDHSMPLHYHKNPRFLLDNPKLIHWFTQNYDYEGSDPKLSPLPIGLDYHTMALRSFYGAPIQSPKKQESELKALLKTLKPTTERSLHILCDFHFNNSAAFSFSHFKARFGVDRKDIYELFQDSEIVSFLPRPIPRSQLWKLQGERAFAISPYGVGLDCHRTWECLILGCIVITKSTPLDPLFQGLPVILVEDYSEITEENLRRWLSEYGDVFHNPDYREKLTMRYWMNQILSYKPNHLKS